MLFLEVRKKMNDQHFYVPSGSVGEIYLDRVDRHWYKHESTDHAKEKVIPFLKILYELIGVKARYWTNQRRLKRNENLPQIITEIIKISTKIIKNFKRIQNLTDDFFSTGEIQTIDYCLEVRQYIENEDFDPFLYNAFEINLKSLKPELEDFYENFKKSFTELFKLMKYNGIVFINDLNKLEKTFFEDLKKQFAKLIILDGKYSSGHFTKIGNIFFERIYQ